MPNFCDNQTLIIGDTAMLDFFRTQFTGKNGEHSLLQQVFPIPQDTENEVVWANQHWGSKTGDYAGELDKIEGVIRGSKWFFGLYDSGYDTPRMLYTYQTAWSPIRQGLEVVSRKFPNLTFLTVWTEEGGTCGLFIQKGGDLIFKQETQWSKIPGYPDQPNKGDDEMVWGAYYQDRLAVVDEYLENLKGFGLGLVRMLEAKIEWRQA